MTWQILLYATLSLTVVRMLPVFLCLIGTRATWRAKLFIGWFGPWGLASIVFGIIVLNQALPGGETILVAAACIILSSVAAHGITANPLIRLLVRDRR